MRDRKSMSNNSVSEHRVGSITAGVSMIIWGVIFILHEINIIVDLRIALRLWPLILVGLGVEILWFNVRRKNIIYDKAAVFLMIIMTGFSMMMAFADAGFKYIMVF